MSVTEDDADGREVDVEDDKECVATMTAAAAAATPLPLPLPLSIYETPLEVIYQDACMAIINKPQGMTVMGGRPSLIRCDLLLPLKCTPSEREDIRRSNTAIDESTVDNTEDKALGKPRPVHRLDNATGGLLVLAKTRRADQNLRMAFRNRQCHKRYRALLIGKLELPAVESKAAAMSSSQLSPSSSLPPCTTLVAVNDDEIRNNDDDDNRPEQFAVDNCHSITPRRRHPQHDAVIVADVDGKESQTYIRIVRYLDAHNLERVTTTTTTTTTEVVSATLPPTPLPPPPPNRNVATTAPAWYTMVDLWPVTGRRHQLRKHMKLIGYSIYGDTRYVASSILAQRHQEVREQEQLQQQEQPTETYDSHQCPHTPPLPVSPSQPIPPPLCLWAMEITLPHPITGTEMTFTIPNHDDPHWFCSIFYKTH